MTPNQASKLLQLGYRLAYGRNFQYFVNISERLMITHLKNHATYNSSETVQSLSWAYSGKLILSQGV